MKKIEDMSPYEYDEFMDACESNILCDIKYCPYIKYPTLNPCYGDFCEEAWDEYCLVNHIGFN